MARGAPRTTGPRLGRATVAMALLALAALAACRPSRPCHDRTVYLTMVLGPLGAEAAGLDMFVALDGGPKKQVFLGKDAGRTLGSFESVEITFDDDVTLQNAEVEVTVLARAAGGNELATAKAKGTVTDRCLALTVDLIKTTDGGADGLGCSVCVSPTSVCERYQGPICADPQWAAWPVPNGAATPTLPNQASYTDNGDGTITDNVTLLMWEKAPEAATWTWPAANDHCQTMKLGPFTDWRLPTEIELLSLVEHARKPAIDETFFPGTSLENYWSATEKVGTSGGAWFVRFKDGRTNCSSDQLDLPETAGDCTSTQYQKDNAYHVRCVR